MLSSDTPHSKRFNQLLAEVRQEVETLKSELSTLEKENAQLKEELKATKEKQADVFSSMKETERMALKHQIKGLVSKIDEHLEEQS